MKSIKKRVDNKKPVTVSNLLAIQRFESFFKVKKENSLFCGKLDVLQKKLIFSAEKEFKNKVEGKPWKIFREGHYIYYCITYNDYYVRDALTGKNVGEATIENDWLQNISVEPNYQRQGIGTNLIRAIAQTMGGNFLIPSKGLPGLTSYYLSEEGAALINSCLRKKIIKEEQCLVDVPPPTPTRSPYRI